jgi:N-methylhydantoinase B
VDYAGSSPASGRGINSPKCYTDAYSVFGLKCLIAPDVPNNAGSLACFEIAAPEGSVVHPLRPAPVTARHVVGQMLPDLMFGCLEQALGGRVPAESAGSIWVLAMNRDAREGAPFNVMAVGLGGTGARPTKDGLSTTAFPSGVGGIPVEVTEAQAPLVFWHKEYLDGSGGAGRWRGGDGGVRRVRFLAPMTASILSNGRRVPAFGLAGGTPGATGVNRIERADGRVETLSHIGSAQMEPGDVFVIETPGGGGCGEPQG